MCAGEYKEHPDLPEDDSAVMYYVMLDMDMSVEDETEERTTIDAEVEVAAGTQAMLFRIYCSHDLSLLGCLGVVLA